MIMKIILIIKAATTITIKVTKFVMKWGGRER